MSTDFTNRSTFISTEFTDGCVFIGTYPTKDVLSSVQIPLSEALT